ncbi:hypothetical protein GTW62_08695 [Streptomyces sp. SID5614]|nr:hypothetical protein [Streptomyces sp. SID5614]
MPFHPVIDTKLNVWTLTAVLTALYTLSGVVRGWWNATLGKRRRPIRGVAAHRPACAAVEAHTSSASPR